MLSGNLFETLENVDAIVPEVGYVTMPADLLAEQFAKIAPYVN